MSENNPTSIVCRLLDEGTNPDFRSLHDLTFEIIRNHTLGKSDEEIWELVDKIEKNVNDELFRKLDILSNDGITPHFDLIKDEDSTYIKFIERPELQFLKKIRLDTPENFEHLCAKVLTRLGADASRTGKSHDGGIDFIGFNLPIATVLGPSTIGAKLLVIGQAKRYNESNIIDEIKLREFIGAAIKRSYELKRKEPERIGALHPTLFAFWTTSDFDRNAKIFAKEMGIWYLSGIAFSQLINRLNIKI